MAEDRIAQELAEAGFARDTKAAKQLTGRPDRNPAPIVSANGVRERVPEVNDIYQVSEAEREAMGVKSHEKVGWERNPNYANKIVGYDTMAARLREDPTGKTRVLRKADGTFYENGDLVAIAEPMDIIEGRRKELEDSLNYTDDVLRNEGDIDKSVPRFRGLLGPEQARAKHQDHIADGMIGPTSGFQHSEIVARMGIEAHERAELEWAAGGMHMHVADRGTRERQTYDEARETRDARGSNRKSFAIGAGISGGKVVR